VWINRWTVLLFLILVRVLLAIGGLNNDLGSAKTEAMSACSGVEDMGSAMASMPHYLSAGVNELAASGVEKAVHALFTMLLLTITGVEELIVFYINMLTSTYLCLITLVIAGSLHVALQVIEDASKFLNKTLKGIGDDLHSGIQTFTDGLNKFDSTINSIPKAFGKPADKIPTLDVNASISKLYDLQLPGDLDQHLTQLNNSIPTFTQVQNFTDNVIRFPFEEVKKLVNDSLSYTFNRSLLPVPEKKQLTFCSDNNGISDFFDGLAHIADVARKVFVVVLVILAILACIPMAIQEFRRWRTMQQRAKLVKDKSMDPLDVIYIASRPYTASAGLKVASYSRATKRQILTRWVIAYATSVPALLVLSLGITGLLACLCQCILLKIVVKEVPALANEAGGFADHVISSLNNASADWANGTNTVINNTNNDINHNLFGWVNITTGAVNDTLNAFINQTTGVLNQTFGGTVLYDPVTQLFNCLVGLKVAGIEKGLTWVSDNAQITIPELPNNTFSLGAAASIASPTPQNASESFLANPGSQAADKITNAVVKVTNHIADAIRTEAIISTCILLLWVLILLLGLARALYLGFKRDRLRGEGGPAVSDGIPLEETAHARTYTMSGPAPAYEPPKRNVNVTTTAFPSFGEPMGQPRRASGGEEEWQDRKLGFAGLRDPAIESGGPETRRSVYPGVEKC